MSATDVAFVHKDTDALGRCGRTSLPRDAAVNFVSACMKEEVVDPRLSSSVTCLPMPEVTYTSSPSLVQLEPHQAQPSAPPAADRVLGKRKRVQIETVKAAHS